MSREHEAAAAATSQLTEQLAVQQLAAKQALKQVRFTACKLVTCSLLCTVTVVTILPGPPSTNRHNIVLTSAVKTVSAWKVHASKLLTFVNYNNCCIFTKQRAGRTLRLCPGCKS